MPDVVVVGGGPVGLLLAGQLAAGGVDVEVLEKRPAAVPGTRAIGVHPPVLRALERSGITEALLSQAQRVDRGEARAGDRVLGEIRFEHLSSRFPFVATLPQSATEAVLAARAPEPLRGATVWEITPRVDGVRVRYGIGGRPTDLSAAILVLAGGAGSRELAFRSEALRSHAYRDRYLMADTECPPRADDGVAVVHLDRPGVLESFPLPGGLRRFVAWDAPGADSDPAARTGRLRSAMARRGWSEAADATAGATAFGVRRVVAPRLRNGRVLVIGDAAHEVSPIGGQGMNLGLLDAATLAPLIREWVRSRVPPDTALRRWERRRVASALAAARLASLNTALGRPLSAPLDALRRTGVRAMLARPVDRVFAHAYAMGFDRDA